jgi:hypothetical protein
LILKTPSGRVLLAKRLEDALGRLWVEQAERREMNIELEGLQNFVSCILDLVLGGVPGRLPCQRRCPRLWS